jgi:hypothetical protein
LVRKRTSFKACAIDTTQEGIESSVVDVALEFVVGPPDAESEGFVFRGGGLGSVAREFSVDAVRFHGGSKGEGFASLLGNFRDVHLEVYKHPVKGLGQDWHIDFDMSRFWWIRHADFLFFAFMAEFRLFLRWLGLFVACIRGCVHETDKSNERQQHMRLAF